MTKADEWRKIIALELHHLMAMCAEGAAEVADILLDECQEITNGDDAALRRMLGAQAAALSPVMDIARKCDRAGTVITDKPFLDAYAPITAVNVVYTDGRNGVTMIATDTILEGSPVMCCGGIQTDSSEILDGSQKQSWYHYTADGDAVKVTELGSLASLLCSAWNGDNNLIAYDMGETTAREVTWLYASKNIGAGEELTVGFGPYWNQHLRTTYKIAKIVPGQADPCLCINGSSPSASLYQKLHHHLHESMNVSTMHAMYNHMVGNASPMQAMYSSLFELSLHCIKNTNKDKLQTMLQNVHQSIDAKSVHDVCYWDGMLKQASCMLDDKGALHELIKKLLKVAEEDLQQHSLSQQYMMADENQKLKETGEKQSREIQQLKRVNNEMHVILRNHANVRETKDAEVQQLRKENDQLHKQIAVVRQIVEHEKGKIKRAKRELE